MPGKCSTHTITPPGRVSYRVGVLRVGDAALVAAVAADYRGVAFE
jgi:molybdopterin synthase catalytic subunit